MSLTTTNPVLPATPAKRPQLSANLDKLIEDYAHGQRVMLPEYMRQEAQNAVEVYERLVSPGPRERILTWLVGVNAGAGNPLGQQEFLIRSAEIVDAVAEFPADVFNAASRRDAQIAFKFFPGVSEVHELLSKLARPIKNMRTGLRCLLNAKQREQAERDALTNEEREVIVENFHQRFETAVSEARADSGQGKPPPAKPYYLAPDQLRAAYQQQQDHARITGNKLMGDLAAARLATLPQPKSDRV